MACPSVERPLEVGGGGHGAGVRRLLPLASCRSQLPGGEILFSCSYSSGEL